MESFKIKDTKKIEKLFEGCNDTLIWSCLQGCMGSAYVDNVDNPKSAEIIIADFSFFAGKPNRNLILNNADNYKSDFMIMIPESKQWGSLIEDVFKEKAKKVKRYALKKEKNIFNTNKLKKIVEGVKEPFEVKMIDEETYNQIIKTPWAKDLCSQFKDYEDYKKRGIGIAILKKGVILSGASSYTVYNEGIEIEIDTRKDYRRKGLALACGAKLILSCIDKGLYPSWDAQNKGSLALAEKLGYHFDKEYTAYEVTNYNF